MSPLISDVATAQAPVSFTTNIQANSVCHTEDVGSMTAANDDQPIVKRPILERRRKRWARRTNT